jgi:hypothetical protein
MILNRTLKDIIGEYICAACLPILLLIHLYSINDCNAYLKKNKHFEFGMTFAQSNLLNYSHWRSSYFA